MVSIMDTVITIIIIVINIMIGVVVSLINCYNFISSLPSLNIMNGTLHIPEVVCAMYIPIGSIRVDSLSWSSITSILSRANGLHLDVNIDGLVIDITIIDKGPLKLEQKKTIDTTTTPTTTTTTTPTTSTTTTSSTDSSTGSKMKERVTSIIRFFQKWIKGVTFTNTNTIFNININDNDDTTTSTLALKVATAAVVLSLKPKIEVVAKGSEIGLVFDSSSSSSIDLLSLSSYSISSTIDIDDTTSDHLLLHATAPIAVGVTTITIDADPITHNAFMDFIDILLTRLKRTPTIGNTTTINITTTTIIIIITTTTTTTTITTTTTRNVYGKLQE